MSKGDDLWLVRNAILKLLYDEGAFYEEVAVPSQAAFKSKVVEKVQEAELDVSERDVEQLFMWLYDEELIPRWSGKGGESLRLTRKGFREAQEIPRGNARVEKEVSWSEEAAPKR